MGVAISAVSYIGTAAAAAAPSPAATPSATTGSLRAAQAVKDAIKLPQSTYSVVAITFTRVALSDTTYTDPSSLYDGLTSSLQNSVTTGVYSTVLRENAAALNATTVEAAQATGTESSPPTVVSADTSGGGGSNNPLQNGGVLAGVVVGIVIFVALVCTALAYLIRGKLGTKQTDTAAGASRDFAITNNPVLPRMSAVDTPEAEL
jgi:hypothetical protein